MTASLPDFKQSLIEFIDQEDLLDDHHPGAAALSLFARSELDDDAAENVRAHLVRCRACLEEVVSLRATRGEVLDEIAGESEVVAFWQKLAPQLATEAGERTATPPPAVLPFPRRAPAIRSGAARSVAWWPLALAAILVASLGLRLLQVQEELQEIRLPRANVGVWDLSSQSSRPRGEPALLPPTYLQEGGLVLLHSPSLEPEIPYRVQVRSADGKRLAEIPDLRVAPPDFNLSLWFPPGFLAAGDYELVLISNPSGGQEELDRWTLRVGERDMR